MLLTFRSLAFAFLLCYRFWSRLVPPSRLLFSMALLPRLADSDIEEPPGAVHL